MISKIFSLRNWVMKQLMKTDESGIMKIPPKGKVDFGEMIIRENLFKKGIDPKTITSERQLDNILNTPTVSPKVKPKKSGEVIEVDDEQVAKTLMKAGHIKPTRIIKKRARKKDGTFIKDDKSTPDVNEAWEQVDG